MKIKKENLSHCKEIFKQQKSTYYFATRFFDKKTRQATWVLYSFFRVPDEIVDNSDYEDKEKIKQKLQQFKKKWKKAYSDNDIDDPVLEATATVFKEYDIPFEHSTSFLNSMIQDTVKKRYENYEELKQYMYGSAAVVGLVMSHVIGFSNKNALKYAKKLGYAMQMTNFLRDINEDFQKRDRVYMPLDELDNHDLSVEDIKKQIVNKDLENFLKFQKRRTRKLYKKSKKGIPMLNKSGRYPVKLALVLYRKFLDKIEENEYDVYQSDLSLNWWDKIKSVYQSYKL